MNPLVRSVCRKRLCQKLLKNNEVLKRLASASCDSFVIQSPYNNWAVPPLNVVDFVWRHLEKWPDHTAIECSNSGRSYKFRELRQACKEFGAGILAELSPGSTVGIIMPNCPEYLVVALGCMEAGFVVSPMNPSYGPAEIKHQVTDSGAKLVFAHPSKVAEVEAACPDIRVLAIGGNSPALEQVISRGKGKDLMVSPDPDSLALLPYSSGTTGLPKGIRLTHNNIVATVSQLDHPEARMPNDATKDFQDMNLAVMPFFHIYGFTMGLLLYLMKGARTIAIPKFEPQSYLNTLQKYKPRILNLVPPLIQFLSGSPLVTKETLSSVLMTCNGAAPLSPAVAEAYLDKSNSVVKSVYGLTEAPPISISPGYESDLSSVGYIVSNAQLKITNIDTGEIQDPGVVGEVCCRGPQMMQGYRNNDEATSSTIKDGWLHTGDIGYVGKDGKLYLVDRMKELIKVKGFQVAPLELESVLMTHPSVADAGVTGVPDARCGETPVAFVVRQPNNRTSDKELTDYLSTKLSSPHKKVKTVVFVDNIPRNASGKILRRVLKQMATGQTI